MMTIAILLRSEGMLVDLDVNSCDVDGLGLNFQASTVAGQIGLIRGLQDFLKTS